VTTQIIPDRLERIMAVPLLKGSHNVPPNGTIEVCAMEAAAYIAGEPHTDHPKCVSPIIATFMRSWNDGLDDADRNRLLKPLIPLVIGTDNNHGAEDRRAWMILDWMIRECTSGFLRAAKLDGPPQCPPSLAPIRTPRTFCVSNRSATVPSVSRRRWTKAIGGSGQACMRRVCWRRRILGEGR
jgi:hypothetical protein